MVSSCPGSAPFCRPKPGSHLHSGGVGQEPEEYIAPSAPVRDLLSAREVCTGRASGADPHQGTRLPGGHHVSLNPTSIPRFAAGAHCTYCWVPKQCTSSVPGAAEGGGVPRGNLSCSIWLAPLIPTLNVLSQPQPPPQISQTVRDGHAA